jgi:hypothetical protein
MKKPAHPIRGGRRKTFSLKQTRFSVPRASLHAKTALPVSKGGAQVASSAPSSDPPRLEIRINVSDRRRRLAAVDYFGSKNTNSRN